MHAQDAIDLVVRRGRGFIDQMLGANYYPGGAESALQSTGSNETVRESVALKLAEAFKRQYGFSSDAFGGHCARNDRPAIDDHRAASALTLRAAAVLGRDHTAPVTQGLEKRRSVFNLDGTFACV